MGCGVVVEKEDEIARSVSDGAVAVGFKMSYPLKAVASHIPGHVSHIVEYITPRDAAFNLTEGFVPYCVKIVIVLADGGKKVA